MQSQAIVFTGPNDISLQTLDVSDPGPGHVQVRTDYSSISSGTEGWVLRDKFSWQVRTPYPCVPGYQRVGRITAIGEGVAGWVVGERVMATTGAWDGPVKSCWGSHASVANTAANEIYRLPEGVGDVDASMLVVAQVGYNAAYRPELSAGDWVIVYGDGIIGQVAAQAARSRGCKVVLVGHRAQRLLLAKAHSAEVVVNNREEKLSAALQTHVGAEHVAAVIDTIQTESAQHEYLPFLKHGKGQIVYSGFTPGTTWADMGALQRKELTAHFIAGWTRPRMKATLRLMEKGQMKMRPLVTHLVPFSRGPEMFAMIQGLTEPFMGITLDWTGAVEAGAGETGAKSSRS